METRKNAFSTAVKLLRELADIQNGPPLVKYENEWNDIMKRVYDFLKFWEKPC